MEPGLYRIGHRGYWHTIIRGNTYYEGWSQPFTVTTPDRAQETFLDEVVAEHVLKSIYQEPRMTIKMSNKFVIVQWSM